MPASINDDQIQLVDAAGNAIDVLTGASATSKSGFLAAGSDGSNVRFLKTTTDGTVAINKSSFEDVLLNQTLTADGAIGNTVDFGDCNLIVIIVSIAGPVTGTTPTLTFTMFNRDHGGNVFGPIATSSTFTSSITTTFFTFTPMSNRVQLNWALTGVSPSFTGVNVSLVGFNTSTPTVTQGTAAAVGGAWPIMVTDGTDTAQVRQASSAAIAADPSLVVALSPNSPVPTGSNTIGKVNQGTAAVVASSWPMLVTDGTDTAQVTPASTAPATTDPALVVGLSPNSAAPKDLTGTGTIVALNGAVTATTNGRAGLMMRVTGVWVATIAIEGTVDGTNYFSVIGLDEAQGVSASFSANQRTYINCSGFQNVRLRASAFTSGTVTVDWEANAAAPPVFQVWNTNAASLKMQARLQDSLGNNITSQAQGAQRPLDVDIVQGGNTAVVKAASTAALATDPSLVVSLSPNNPIPTGSNSIGSVTQGTAAASSGGWPVKITDGTDNAEVKAASTAAAAADTALVVALSPNSPTPGVADVTATGALGALNAAVSATIPGEMSTGMQLAAGTLIGTLTPQYTYDGGTTWNPTYFSDPGTGTLAATLVFGANNTATSRIIVAPAGAGQVRVTVSSYTSGTANITLRASTVQCPVPLFAGIPAVPTPPTIAQVGGSDGTNLRALSVDTSGRPVVVFPTATLSNGAETAVAGSAVSVLAANASRKTAIIQNTGLANVRVGVTGVAATTGVRVAPGDMVIFDMPYCPTAAIFAIREGATSSTVFAMEIA